MIEKRRIKLGFRYKVSSNSPYRKRSDESVGSDYDQFVDRIANQVRDSMQQMRYPYDKALGDTIDSLLGTLADFSTSAWVLENSKNRDAFRGSKNVEGLYSSAAEALVIMAMSAIEQDVIEVLQGNSEESFDGESKTVSLGEVPEGNTTPIDYTEEELSIGKTQPNPLFTPETRPYPVKGASVSSLRIPRQ
jgi:hypothetical protein